ncbi:anaerobic ribonucleoside-triphosphate reductase activating protein [Peptostreptococcus faecalis]|uniref:anaerobic ribonucleoside-triphosphate reductase activating protein n=1 Tax=Peptostreptococcus faecalis TaxID=2045015 RepID=UPI000C7D03E8|nr:anaerobic ribonucleoside-triphosphate reductase activating protein [Peptostreptococcus faecalis]
MKIGGLQKLTLLDYPNEIACIVFTQGCNFRCPYCHNSELVVGDNTDELQEDDVIDFLKKRKKVLDAVVISGGEPLIHSDIEDFIDKIRSIGYKIKLDTNGSFPDKLRKLIKDGKIDYVAMDIKNSKKNYERAIGIEHYNKIEDIEKSIEILKSNSIEFELRTTLVKGIHSKEDIESMAKWISGNMNYYLQNYLDSGDVLLYRDEIMNVHQIEYLGKKNLEIKLENFSKDELQDMLTIAKRYCPNTYIR